MIDIVNFQPKQNLFNFSKIYQFSDFKIVIGSDDQKNRKAVENKNVDILMNPEKTRTTDFMHYRDSGLNQVLCKLAYQNKVAIGFNFNNVLKSKNRSLILGKMMQNVRLCRKYKVAMVICSGANNEWELRPQEDLKCFGISIGMTPLEAKKALNFEKKKVK